MPAAATRSQVAPAPNTPGPNDENGRPVPSVTSSARTIRRVFPGSILPAATGSSSASSASSVVFPSGASARS